MRSVFLLSLPLLLGACLYGEFDDIESEAPVGVYEAESYPNAQGFGRVLHAYGADGPARSRVVANAGPASKHIVFDVWSEAASGGESALYDGCDNNCDEGTGSDLVSIGSWQDRDACILISSQVLRDRSQDGRLRIQCEERTGETVLIATGRSGESMGAALAPLRGGGALIGAPGAERGLGGLYVLPANGEGVEALTLPALDLAPNAGLGSELATFEVEDANGLTDAHIVLAAAPGMERVAALLVGNDTTGTRVVEALACIDGVDVRSPSDLVEEGGGMTLVDSDGDGRPEALIGDPRADRVLLVPLSGLSGGVGCADAEADLHPGTQVITCADLPADERVVCDGLGTSVAAGDFDGDGDEDLVLGAALSSVGGAANAGSLYVLPNSAGFDAGAGLALSVSSAIADAGLGTRVVVTQSNLSTTPRDEPVSSAPGVNKLYIFYCTGLAGDAAEDGQRCLGTLP